MSSLDFTVAMALPAYIGRLNTPSSSPTAMTSVTGATSSFAANLGSVSLHMDPAAPQMTLYGFFFCRARRNAVVVSATGCSSMSLSACRTLVTPLMAAASFATPSQPLPITSTSMLVEPGSFEAAVAAWSVALASVLLSCSARRSVAYERRPAGATQRARARRKGAAAMVEVKG